MSYMRLTLLFTAAVIALGIAISSCGRPATSSPPGQTTLQKDTQEPVKPTQTTSVTPIRRSIVIYSGRTEGLVKPIIDQFSQATGIKVQVRYGGTSELAATILEEGRNSPADIYFAQDPGGLGAIEQLLTPLSENLLNKVEPRFRSPEGKWIGISGRARVVVYNTQKLRESDLPDDIWDFVNPKWKGRMGWAPTNASFQAMVTAMRNLWGEEKSRQWLLGMKMNSAKIYSNNTSIVNAVGSGEVEIGFPNHYYLFGIMQEKGETYPVRNYYLRGGGPGAVILVAGAGILETSKNKQAAESFLEFMLSPVAQQYFTSQTFEYPVIVGVKTHSLIVPLDKINSPNVTMSAMADLRGTLGLLRETGILP